MSDAAASSADCFAAGWLPACLPGCLPGCATIGGQGLMAPLPVHSAGVKIKKCRYLESSGCVGMCGNMCKLPTQKVGSRRHSWGLNAVHNKPSPPCAPALALYLALPAHLHLHLSPCLPFAVSLLISLLSCTASAVLHRDFRGEPHSHRAGCVCSTAPQCCCSAWSLAFRPRARVGLACLLWAELHSFMRSSGLQIAPRPNTFSAALNFERGSVMSCQPNPTTPADPTHHGPQFRRPQLRDVLRASAATRGAGQDVQPAL